MPRSELESSTKEIYKRLVNGQADLAPLTIGANQFFVQWCRRSIKFQIYTLQKLLLETWAGLFESRLTLTQG